MSSDRFNNKLVLLEFSRFIAALLVVLSHANMFAEYTGDTIFNGIWRAGTCGVDFFFVLSGFIIFYVHRADIGQKEKVANYFWRRFRRVYPLYAFVTLGCILLILLGIYRQDVTFSLARIFTNITLIPTNWVDYPIISPAWSLGHEILFYAYMGVLIWNARIGIILGVVWACALIACAVMGINEYPYAFVFAWMNIQFFLGIAAAMIAVKIRKEWSRYFLLIGLIGFFAGFYMHGTDAQLMKDAIIYRIWYGVFAAIIIIGCATHEPKKENIKLTKTLFFLGGASYSIYLVHFCVLEVMHYFYGAFRFSYGASIYFPIHAIISLAGGIIVYKFVDKKLLAVMPSSWEEAKEKFLLKKRLLA